MENVEKLPKHIAVIMDGNRRFAKKKKLSVADGHRAGADALERIINYCVKIGVKFFTVYAFSTENWKRSSKEVNDLMGLMREYLDKLEKDNKDRNARIIILGDTDRLDYDLQEKIKKLQDSTKDNTGLTVNIALNYGGRDEIINAIKKIPKDKLSEITEETFEKYLYTVKSPDPDLIVRTSGEQRLSNFLLWQSAYSEFYFTDVLWPEFSEKDFDKAIEEYNNRKRNFGGTK